MLLFLLTINIAQSDPDIKDRAWENKVPLKVKICKGAPVKKQQVAESLDYWSHRFPTENISIEEDADCPKWDYQTVQIMFDKNITKKHYGFSDVGTYNKDGKKYIHSVNVRLPNHLIVENNITLKHELGHALGLSHSDHGIMKSHY